MSERGLESARPADASTCITCTPFQSAVAVRDATLTIATTLQADCTAGRVEGVDGMNALLLDVANAFGTVWLDKALATLRKHLPELVRWFTIQHESRILLVHASLVA